MKKAKTKSTWPRSDASRVELQIEDSLISDAIVNLECQFNYDVSPMRLNNDLARFWQS